jgi:mRNA-degrading endonuclease toxin of MazEF toxin-antitoxin module
MIDVRRGDVVLVAFPSHSGGTARRKRRPAVVVQADGCGRRRAAVILAAITSTRAHRELPSKVTVSRDSTECRRAGLRTDSVVDCRTLVTIPCDELAARLGRISKKTMTQIDRALGHALGLPS